MTPYRQLILPGDVGVDVRAVKRAMIRMRAHGVESLMVSDSAGSQFVKVLNDLLRAHHMKADGKYGPSAHALIAPHFDLYGAALYKRAKIRTRMKPRPAPGHATARSAAQRLLVHAKNGAWRADNPGDLGDVQRTARGDPVWSHLGRWVYVDHRPLELVLWLIEERHYAIGTYAICSDHHNDGPHGHAGGFAIDISSVNGRGIGGWGSHDITLACAKAIRFDAPAALRPRQLICDGAGNVRFSDIAACCLPYEGFYDGQTLAGHRNHIHGGY